MNSATEAIRAEKLVKTFGSVTALAGVSLIDLDPTFSGAYGALAPFFGSWPSD
jgi:hypothetical protein